MPTQNVSTMPDTAFVAIDHTSGLIPTRSWVATAWERGNQWIRSPLLRIRPRVSLFSGSVLVLLTLFLPIAYESCGPAYTGYEFAREGEGDWPTFLGSISHEAGRGFYTLSLALAALTILVMLPLRRRDLLRKQRLIGGLFVIAGTISLFAVLDLFLVEALDRLPQRLEWLATVSLFVYTVAPLALWYFRFSRRDKIRAQWPRIRRGLIALYIPVVLVDCDALARWTVSRGLWGLIPYFIGISLISLGYMQLQREAKMSVTLRSQPERGPSLTHPARM